MQRYTILKTGIPYQAAHLYEHMFARTLVNFFRGHNLFLYIDYFFRADTYNSSMVQIHMAAINNNARVLIAQVENLNIDFDSSLAIATRQIEAEDRIELLYSKRRLMQLLEEGQTRPWKNLNELASYDAHYEHIHVTELSELKKLPEQIFETLRLEVLCNAEFVERHRHLLPLFRLIAHALGDNLSEQLANTYGYYAYKDDELYTKTTVKCRTKLRISKKIGLDLTNAATVCDSLLNQMIRHDIVERLANNLSKHPPLYPPAITNAVDTYELTGVLTGGAGWQELATPQKILEVLEHTNVQLSNEHQHLRLQMPIIPKTFT